MTEYTAKKVYIKDAAGDYAIPYVNPADNTNLGVVRPDGSTITVNNGVLSTNNKNLRAISAYANEGELLTDPDGLAFVEKYAHSTFDRSKFTTSSGWTGNITEDGIASGFTGGGWLLCPSYNFVSTAIMEFEFTPSSLTTGGSNYGLIGGGANTGLYLAQNNDEIRLFFSVDGSTWAVGNLTIYTGLVVGKSYKVKAVHNSLGVIIYLNGAQKYSNQTAGKLHGLPYEFGRVNFSGTMDLKQISITVDGVEVFSGNKTGIDTIKADDWTIPSGVSAPTITADGILTSTDSTHYITKSFTNQSWGKWEITFNNFHAGTTTTALVAFDMYGAGGNRVMLRKNSNGQIFLYIGVNGANVVQKYFNEANIINGIVGYDGTKYYWTINGVSDNLTSSAVFPQTDYTIYFGCFYDHSNAWLTDGSIDLNSFKIYVDGNLVYQPCLKIPYTESKTGSKIVGSVYRDRVNDMAEQFGYANYYTLDEDNGNFTLPQVELYGLIGQRTLRDSYRNGINYWELYSNRDLEQGGSCTSGVEVTFPKPFADTNYVLSVPYSAKSATAFTPTQTGDWIAKGKGVL